MPSRPLKRDRPSTKSRPNAQDPVSPEDEIDAEPTRTTPSTSTARSETSHTRKRKRQKEDGKPPADQASAKKKKKRKNKKPRKKTRVVDATFLYDPDDVEPPTEADFNGVGALSRRKYPQCQHKEPDQNCPLEDGEMSEPKVPEIPAFDDDTPQMVMVRFDTDEEGGNDRRKKSVKPKVVQRAKPPARRAQPVSDEFARPDDESEDNPMDEQPEQVPATEEPFKREPPNFMNIPVEIRDKIYRELLAINKAISVHGGWKLVYKRNKLGLPTSILRVCGQVHDEASRVLYGENTFLYRLRDPTSAVKNVDRLATDDTEPPEGDEGDSGSEWEGEPVPKRHAKKSEWDINIDRYSHLFRSIAVEAEHNRYSEDTQDSMAGAIKVFSKRRTPPSKGKAGAAKRKFNIRTLTIRVTPLWNPTGGEDGEGAFTFVDFFKPKSPVLKAMKEVQCQFLRVDLLTRYMGKSPLTAAESGACRLTMDRRHERIYNMVRENGKGDEWAKDSVMRQRRWEMARKSIQAVDKLAVHVERECGERDFGMRTTEDWALNGLDWLSWDELTDDEGDI